MGECGLASHLVPSLTWDGVPINNFEIKFSPCSQLIQKHRNTYKPGVYTKFSGRLSEEPFSWLIQKFPCILISKTGQPGRQLNLSKGQIRLDLTSGRPLVLNPANIWGHRASCKILHVVNQVQSVQPGPASLWMKSVFLFRYGDYHYKDKSVLRPSYLCNGNSYTGKMASSYWDGPQNLFNSPKWCRAVTWQVTMETTLMLVTLSALPSFQSVVSIGTPNHIAMPRHCALPVTKQ